MSKNKVILKHSELYLLIFSTTTQLTIAPKEFHSFFYFLTEDNTGLHTCVLGWYANILTASFHNLHQPIVPLKCQSLNILKRFFDKDLSQISCLPLSLSSRKETWCTKRLHSTVSIRPVIWQMRCATSILNLQVSWRSTSVQSTVITLTDPLS